MKTKSSQTSVHGHRHTANFWAVITLLAFPVTMFVSTRLGVHGGSSFLLGLLASFGVICLDAILEDRLWFYDPRWKARLESPDFSFRLAVVCGLLFFLMETALLFVFFSSPGLDRSLLSLVLSRECVQPKGDFVQICSGLQVTPPNE